MGDFTNSAATTRYPALDGLRGLAAFAVVLHHCLLVSPQLAIAADSGALGQIEGWAWWITYTPLHLIWAGKEAVYVFFILSGFVLVIPFIGNANPDWPAYFLKRILRIYLPVGASLVLALTLWSAFPREAGPEYSTWVNLHDEAPNVLSDALLLWGAGSLNSPLWSLHWEMMFSLLLPLYVLGALFFRRLWLVGVAGIVVLIGLAELVYFTGGAYLLIFGVGALMATQRDSMERWGRTLRMWQWASLLATSVALLCSHWIFPELPVHICLATAGGSLLIFAFIAWRPVSDLGNKPLLRWLGLRSFSLYLVHEPIIVSVTFMLNSSNPLQVALIAVPLSLAVAELFFRCVENPSHRLSSAVGRAVGKQSVGRRTAVASS